MKKKIHITETVLRDAHQCLLATRMRTEDMLPIAPVMDQIGYWAIESWGGATFDTCLRFLKEDPWERLRFLKKAMPNTPLSMLVRGQNLVGYRHYPDDIVRAFIAEAAKCGVDVFRVFDALNDLRNTETVIKAIKAAGKHAQGAMAYTISPVHTIEQYVDLAKKYVEMGCDSLAIKDMAGLLTPKVTAELHRKISKAVGVPLHNHSHATSGVSSLCMQAAIDEGCPVIDTAISSFSEGASHPCTESMVIALRDTQYDTQLDLLKLNEIAEYFYLVRKKYHRFESAATGIDPRVSIYQVPGGMISNLYNQLKEQNALDKMQMVREEIPRVRADLGYPPLVTPTSQIVGTQAVMNVMTGERYKTITNEVKLYCQGKYGKPPGEVNADVRKKAIGQATVIEGRPADLLSDELPSLRAEIKDLALTETDVLSYALFPDIAKIYFQERKNNALMPEPIEIESNIAKAGVTPKSFNISFHGEQYAIKIKGTGQTQDRQRSVYLTLDDVPEEVVVEVLEVGESSTSQSVTGATRPKASSSGDVTVSMPSTVIDVRVAAGDAVKAGDVVIVVEAMKMQTEIQAPVQGVVQKVLVKKGDTVIPQEVLIKIE